MAKKETRFCFVLFWVTKKRETKSSRVGSNYGEIILTDTEIREERMNYKTWRLESFGNMGVPVIQCVQMVIVVFF